MILSRILVMCRQVVMLTRAELLASAGDYKASFVPIEASNEAKDEVEEAIHYFEEVRVAQFDKGQLSDYVHAYVALRARERFECRVGTMEVDGPAAPRGSEKDGTKGDYGAAGNEGPSRMMLQLAKTLQDTPTWKASASLLQVETLEKSAAFLETQFHAVMVTSSKLSTADTLSVTTTLLADVNAYVDAIKRLRGAVSSLDFSFALLAARRNEQQGISFTKQLQSKDVVQPQTLRELREAMRADQDWSVREFKEALAGLTELGALLTTPFAPML